MGDCKSVVPGLEGEGSLIAAAKHIVEVLESKKDFTDDVRKILADLGSQLSLISRVDEREDHGVGGIEERLDAIEDKIMNWELKQSMLWDSGPEEAYEYLKAVDEALKLTANLENLCESNDGEGNVHLHRVRDLLLTAMARLEEEFKHILIQSRQPFEPEHMSFRSSEEDLADEGSFLSFGDDSVEDVVIQRDSISRGSSQEFLIDLVHPNAIPDLKCIVNLMFGSNYGQECSQAFISVRKDALDDYLFSLDIKKLSIEDVLKMEWSVLNTQIKRWIRAMKMFIRIYLASEKWLSDQIFGELESVSSICFAESSKTSILQVLNFCEAVAITPPQPEKLFRILDMYEVLAELIPDIEALYPNETETHVGTECHVVLKRLGDCANATFVGFENAVASNTSTSPFAGGGIHHLTRYVMNYIKTLTDYGETLSAIHNGLRREDSVSVSSSPERSSITEVCSDSGSSSSMALGYRSLVSVLEGNLDDKSKLYKDESVSHLFMMNNIHYMVEKVKGSGLRDLLGDDWIRKHNWKFQQHAMKYERATWSPVLVLLKDEGIHNPGSSSISKTLVKEKLRSFYLAFEDVYRNQTSLFVRDVQLREDLIISTSLHVVQAYRTFVGRYSNYISDKHIKYSADDLGNCLLDLLQGSPKSLHNFHSK